MQLTSTLSWSRSLLCSWHRRYLDQGNYFAAENGSIFIKVITLQPTPIVSWSRSLLCSWHRQYIDQGHYFAVDTGSILIRVTTLQLTPTVYLSRSSSVSPLAPVHIGNNTHAFMGQSNVQQYMEMYSGNRNPFVQYYTKTVQLQQHLTSVLCAVRRGTYMILVGNPEGKRPDGSWENNIKMNI